jgi:hypothetical protein
MSARHIELWLNSIPCQAGLTLSLKTGLFDAPIAEYGIAYMPAAFGSDPSRQSHERWLICR